MATYEFKALDAGGRQSEGVLEAESSQEVVRHLKEQGLLPVVIKPAAAGADAWPSASSPPQAARDETKDYAFGWRIRLRRLFVFHLPLGLLSGIEFYLFFHGKPMWWLAILAVGGLLGFGVASMAVAQKMLSAFVCPRCKSRIEDWGRNEKYRVFYDCGQCGIRWDIGYKLRSGRRNR